MMHHKDSAQTRLGGHLRTYSPMLIQSRLRCGYLSDTHVEGNMIQHLGVQGNGLRGSLASLMAVL